MGSRYFGSQKPKKQHLVRDGKGGLAGEIGDLRSDVERAFAAFEAERGSHPPCRLATAAALNACTAAGTGVGKTLTQNAAAVENIDGVAPVVGDRVLVKNQVAAKDNGPYTVTVVGTVAVKQVLTRATDFDEDADAKCGASFSIEEGSVNANTIWQLTTPNPITLDTTALTFAEPIPVEHAALHIGGAADEIDGDNLDIDFTPLVYTPDATPAEAAGVDSLTAHLKGIDTIVGDHDGRHILGGADEIDGDQLDIDMTPTNYTPDAGVPEGGDVDHLAGHLGGIDNELGTIKARTGAPTIRATRAPGGTLAANGTEDLIVIGSDLLQGQTFAQITLGASLDIIAEIPGAPGNALSVEIIDSAGVGGLAVSYAAGKLTIDLDGDTPTEDQIATAVNTTGAWDGIFRANSGGGAAFGTVAETLLTGGGTGLGFTAYVGGGVCAPAGEAGGGATSNPSLSETTCTLEVPDLTALTPALQAADDVAVWAVSNGVATNSGSTTLA